jgi:DNA-binding protein HU-beta
MTNKDLVVRVAAEHGVTKAVAGKIIDFIGRVIIADLLLDGRSQYPNLGIFTVVTRAAKACINPSTGRPVGVKPAYKTVKFKPYKALKEQVGKG